MNYVLSPEAADELSEAALFCKEQFGAMAAESFLATFESKACLLGEFPGVGTPALKGRRMFPVGRFPFSMLYRVDGGVIRIIAIAHHGRRPGYWRDRQ